MIEWYYRTYGYTPIGNIASTSHAGAYSYAETGDANPHAATQIGSETLTYDDNGNVTSHASSTFTWDYANRLTASSDGSVTTTYAYDFDGQRVSKSTSATTTVYANDLYNITGSTTVKHIYANDELVATIETDNGTTSTQYIHPDHLGGTHLVTDSGGDINQELAYYPYGATRIDNQYGSYDELRRFTGHELDKETDLTYAKARYYDHNVGRWLSQDPAFINLDRLNIQLKDPQSWNSYSYARNNPLVLSDPTGEFWWSGFYTNWSGYEGMSGLAMKAGEVMGGRFAAQDAIAANARNIANSSAQTGVSPAMYQAIMYEENAHQLPPFGGERALENLSPNSFSGGVGVMQVSSLTSGLPNTALINDATNVSAAGGILQGIQSNYGSNPSIMGAYYNSGAYGPGNAHANLYGQRINSYTNMSFTPTLGDRVVRGSVSSISSSLSSISSALSRISDALKKRKEE